ncbi:MAG: DUF805 domain-containing protein [Bacteroidales bacterium]
MKWYLKVITQYADFKGRSRRKEYWIFVLFNALFGSITQVLDNILGLNFEPLHLGIGWFSCIYGLIILIPSFAVVIRRLHDIGKSGWNYLISFIPIVGWIILLIWLCRDSVKSANKWGLNPKIWQ